MADPNRLYNAMHRYLHDSGVDGVKVDCQAGVGLIGERAVALGLSEAFGCERSLRPACHRRP